MCLSRFLKVVLAPSRFGEDVHERCACHVERCLQIFTHGPQERVGSFLKPQSGRHGRGSFGPHGVNLLRSIDQIGIARFNSQRELCIRLGVLVGAVDCCVVRHRHQFLKGCPHLVWRPFEKAATAERKQGVAHEGHAIFFKPIGDMALGVAGHIEHFGRMVAKLESIIVTKGDVDARDALLVGAGTDNLTPGFGFERLIAARMVEVMMCIEDVCQLPTLLGKGGFDRGDFRRVDGCGKVLFTVVDQESVIVAETWELMHFEFWHEKTFRRSALISERQKPIIECGFI